MADIFISYKREDQEEHGRVKPLADALRAEGYEVFYDVYVPPGSKWEDVLERKIADARAVIVLWSASSVESDWVKEEAEMAKAAGKLIPVMLDPVSPPFGFTRIEAANLIEWDGDLTNLEWNNLVAAVKARIGEGGGPAQAGVTAVAYPRKTVTVTKTSGTGSGGGGAIRMLAIGAATIAIAALAFFGFQTWQSNQMLADRAQDDAFDTAMTREIDGRAWKEAQAADTIVAYRRYLDLRPSGAYRADALARIDELESAAAAASTEPSAPPMQPAEPSVADLEITDLGARPSTVEAGQQTTVDLRVSNVGTQTAPGASNNGYVIDLVLSRDSEAPLTPSRLSTTWSEDVLLPGGRVSSGGDIIPRRFRDFAVTVTIPDGFPAGRFNVCAVVDPGRTVAEAGEGNNVRCTPLRVTAPVAPPAPTGETGPPPGINEDCLSYSNVTAREANGQWQVISGRSLIQTVASREEASTIVRLIQAYGLTEHCFVERPNPGLSYWKTSGGGLPTGNANDPDCLNVDAANLAVRVRGGMSLVMNGDSSMLRFRERSSANDAVRIMQHYGARQICYVGRPGPSMTYLKR